MGSQKRILVAESASPFAVFAGYAVGRHVDEVRHLNDYNVPFDRIQRFEVNENPQKANINMVAILLSGAVCVAQRGRYTKPDGGVEQHFEVQAIGKTNTLTTVQKDNMVAQPILLVPPPIEIGCDCIINTPDGKKLKLYQVINGQIEINGKRISIKLADGFYIIRPLTVAECCRLQTLPDNYCWMAKKTHAYRGLGNGWTAEVIIHILSHALAGIPKDEEIVVLSLYDGIGTGRYCFDRLGYRNIQYFAYEIEKSVMEIASTNFPDIVQCGDAFQVRETGWELPL